MLGITRRIKIRRAKSKSANFERDERPFSSELLRARYTGLFVRLGGRKKKKEKYIYI